MPEPVERFGLYLVMTDPKTGYERCTEAAVACGLRYVQLRMKHTPQDQVARQAERLLEITQGSRTRLIVNDDVEVAREVNADGVHLGQDDLPLAEARKRWPVPGKSFGLSSHNVRQARDAESLHPDILGVGPVYATPTKEVADPTVGLDTMGSIVRQSPLCTVAIGGINAENLSQVLQAGAVNFAVVRAVTQADDPKAAIRALMDIWQRHEERR